MGEILEVCQMVIQTSIVVQVSPSDIYMLRSDQLENV